MRELRQEVGALRAGLTATRLVAEENQTEASALRALAETLREESNTLRASLQAAARLQAEDAARPPVPPDPPILVEMADHPELLQPATVATVAALQATLSALSAEVALLRRTAPTGPDPQGTGAATTQATATTLAITPQVAEAEQAPAARPPPAAPQAAHGMRVVTDSPPPPHSTRYTRPAQAQEAEVLLRAAYRTELLLHDVPMNSNVDSFLNQLQLPLGPRPAIIGRVRLNPTSPHALPVWLVRFQSLDATHQAYKYNRMLRNRYGIHFGPRLTPMQLALQEPLWPVYHHVLYNGERPYFRGEFLYVQRGQRRVRLTPADGPRPLQAPSRGANLPGPSTRPPTAPNIRPGLTVPPNRGGGRGGRGRGGLGQGPPRAATPHTSQHLAPAAYSPPAPPPAPPPNLTTNTVPGPPPGPPPGPTLSKNAQTLAAYLTVPALQAYADTFPNWKTKGQTARLAILAAHMIILLRPSPPQGNPQPDPALRTTPTPPVAMNNPQQDPAPPPPLPHPDIIHPGPAPDHPDLNLSTTPAENP